MAAARCPPARSSEASLVASPLQPKASPAPIIVTDVGEWRTALSR